MPGDKTLAAGESVEIVSRQSRARFRIDVKDGQAAIVSRPNYSPNLGNKLQPGEYAIVKAPRGETRHLRAVGGDVTYEVTRV